MRTSYPLFRDGDETAQAVIGEEAAASDLDGVYQKPYAVLTQKRLYCKNEQGNFIVDASALRSTGKASSMKNNWFVWAVAGCLALTLIVLACQQLLRPSRNYHRWRSWQARRVITDYETLEAKTDGYRQAVKTYENTLAQKEQHEQDLQKLDPARVRQEAEAHQEQIASLQGEIRSNEDQINKYEREISLTQDRIDSLPQWLGDAQKQLASYQSTLQVLENLALLLVVQQDQQLQKLDREREREREDRKLPKSNQGHSQYRGGHSNRPTEDQLLPTDDRPGPDVNLQPSTGAGGRRPHAVRHRNAGAKHRRLSEGPEGHRL